VLLLLVGFTGGAIGAFYGVAQSMRTIKTRSTAGVSRLSWLISATASGLWMVYGALERSGPQILANTPWFVSCALIGYFMARESVLPKFIGYLLPWGMLVVGLVLLTAERSALAIIGPAFGVGMTVPQMVAARRATSVEGVSAPAWVTSVLSGVLWVIYGVGSNDIPITVSSATATTLNVFVLALVLQAQRRTRLGVPATEMAPARSS
jgi:uncharacterized protein with PQ loop repeat